MNQVIMRKKTVATTYEPISETPIFGTFDISTALENSAAVNFRNDLGEDIPWAPGEFHTFSHVDLSKIFVKGAEGDVVTAIGDSRTHGV